jgi:hypothetical protein
VKNALTKELIDKLHDHFRRMVRAHRILRGSQQELETLISEEALLFAKFLRSERVSWIPRIAVL